MHAKIGEDRAASDILGDAEDSEDAYSCIMIGKEAGVLLCSLTSMVKIHQSDSCLKVQISRPWLDKRRVS